MMSSGLASARGVSTERFVPEIANQVPHLRIRWKPSVVKVSHAEAVRQLQDGEPSIETVPASYVKETLEFSSWTFQPGDAELVTRRLKEILKAQTMRTETRFYFEILFTLSYEQPLPSETIGAKSFVLKSAFAV